MVVQGSERGLRVAGFIGSTLIHVGMISCLLLQSQNHLLPTRQNGTAEHGDLIMVEVSSSHSTQAISKNTPDNLSAKHFAARSTPLHSAKSRPQTAEEANDQTDAHLADADAGIEAEQQMASLGAPAQVSTAMIGVDYARRLGDHLRNFQRRSGTGLSGVVEMQFELNRAGQVLDIWVTRSSGYRLLDQEAVETVRRAAPLPPIPTELPDPYMIEYPMSFHAS